MTLALRRTVLLEGERRPNDYEVRHDDQTIGRIYRMRSTGREVWQWTQIGVARAERRPDTLGEAKAAFRAAWERRL